VFFTDDLTELPEDLGGHLVEFLIVRHRCSENGCASGPRTAWFYPEVGPSSKDTAGAKSRMQDNLMTDNLANMTLIDHQKLLESVSCKGVFERHAVGDSLGG
jgi:hypothetical protein